MGYPKGQHPGATWKKSDFQCHTPHDPAWKSGPELPGGAPALEGARRDWSDEFIAECVKRGLTVVAVTDHHDAAMIPYIQEASRKSRPEITVFPGIEITCKDNVQCLAILDPRCGPESLNKLLCKLDGIMPADSSEAKAPPVKIANMTIEELFAAIDGEEHLRDITVLIPHFSTDDAHKSLNVSGHHPRFVQLDCDGVYVERPYTSLDKTTLDKIQGRIREWGNRRRAILATGDNRSGNWDRLGVHDCWIKLGEDSAEALRQAFLADEARITFSPPEVPADYIVRMTVQSSLTGREPLTVTFNEGLNTFIGGRGSGKTSLLEYLRFGLARSDRDFPNHETGPIRGREAQLIADTLKSGYIEIELSRAGAREIWRRDLATADRISVTDTRGDLTTLPLEEAQRRFPARAFHQKGLSSTTADPTTAADQITGIAAAEALDKRREIDKQINNAKRQVTTTLQLLVAHWQRRLESAQCKGRVLDLKTRLAAVSAKLKEEGVSPEHIKVLETAPRYSRVKNHFATVDAQIRTTRSDIEQLSSGVLLFEKAQSTDADEFPEVVAIDAAVEGARARIRDAMLHALKALDELERTRKSYSDAFDAKDFLFQEQYTAAVAQQTAQQALIDENKRLTSELKNAEAAEAKAVAAEKKSASAEAAFAGARGDLAQLLIQRRAILAEAADHVAGKSSEMLKARVKKDPKPSEYVSSIARLLDRSNVIDAQTKCDEWIAAVLNRDSENAWAEICDRVLRAYEAKIMAGSPPEPGIELSKQINQMILDETKDFTERQCSRIFENLTDASVGAILAATPRDYIVFKYVEDGKEMPFERASPGQQASALLELLLSQFAGTLIIDQPEDDIDNRIIMKVVNLIRSSKHRRQLIFATHNANVVVNGDADKVIALHSADVPSAPTDVNKKIDISSDGAIETTEVRKDITRIMEGGRQAFHLRSRKYHFDDQDRDAASNI